MSTAFDVEDSDIRSMLVPFTGHKAKFAAFVGSRKYPKLGLVRQHVRAAVAKYGDVCVVSGTEPGERKDFRGRTLWGVDEAAIDEARKAGAGTIVLEPAWEELGRAAGPIRNEVIVRNATDLVAYWDRSSRGTAWAILAAAKRGILRAVFDEAGEAMDLDAAVALASEILA